MAVKIYLVLALALFLIFLFFLSQAPRNLWFLLTESDYVIPKESSVFRFNATVINMGSSNWWIYGEDAGYYYHFIGSEEVVYERVSRKQAENCAGFNPQDVSTWCITSSR